MRNRDKAILNDLNRFRCMSRDDIVDLHFNHLKNAVTCCNAVLKRLRRDGHIEANTKQQPYTYFPSPTGIKKDSQKIPHFLAIVDVYKQLIKHDIPRQFIVEPKYGKDYMEPDIFAIWRKAPFFIEVQLSIYSEKVMFAKLERYKKYFDSDLWRQEQWQPQNNKIFPNVIILTDKRYGLPDYPFRVFQARNIDEFLNAVAGDQPQPKQPSKNEIVFKGSNIKFKSS